MHLLQEARSQKVQGVLTKNFYFYRTLKHLLDAKARIEQWPGGRQTSCDEYSGSSQTVCRKLNHYDIYMRTREQEEPC